MNFSHKDPDEVEYLGFDLAARLAAGETLLSVVFHVEVIDGADPAAASMILGAASIVGAIVRQKMGAGVAGVRYRISAHAVTSTGQTLVEAATLEVRDVG